MSARAPSRTGEAARGELLHSVQLARPARSVAALVLPSAIAWYAAAGSLHASRIDRAVGAAIGPLLLAALVALAARSFAARRAGDASLRDGLDLLTATGRATAWTGGLAIVGAVTVGWASLSVLGLLALASVHLAVIAAALLARGGRLEGLTVERRFVPAVAREGEPVLESLRLAGLALPPGYRLFVEGDVGRRLPRTRHVFAAREIADEILVESDLGRAVRGEHEAPPLRLWLEDLLGLCRTPAVRRGGGAEARLVVLPRPAAVEGLDALVGAGRLADATRDAERLPTDGSLRLREYVPGDDARRVSWARSLRVGSLIVRLPDEIPLDEPAVRLVLDTQRPGPRDPATAAPDELLDGMVRIWLGLARALADRGTRVTLVAALADRASGAVRLVERPFRDGGLLGALDTGEDPLRLGARVAWQDARPATEQLALAASSDGGATDVVLSFRAPPTGATARWIVVPAALLVAAEAPPAVPSGHRLPYPMGAEANRPSRRRRARARLAARMRDRAAFDQATRLDEGPLAAHAIATPRGGAVLLAAPPAAPALDGKGGAR